MSQQISRDRIRMSLADNVVEVAVDNVTSQAPSAFRGNDLQVEVALLAAGDLADISNVASVQMVVETTRGWLPVMSSTVASGDLQVALTLSDWESNDPTKYHALFKFTGSDTLLFMGSDTEDFWFAIYALTNDTPARKVTWGVGFINFVDDGTTVSAPSFVQQPTYLTLAQADARYTVSGTKVNKSGDVMTGQLTFSGATNGGVVLSNIPNTGVAGLTALYGMLIFNTTTNQPQIYTPTGWAGFVTTINGLSGTVVLTTSGIAEGTSLYFTNPRAIGATLTGFVAGAGAVTSADSVLTAIQKLAGNIGAGGTVTSVGISLPSFLSVTGSPVTTSGTLAVTINNQSQGLVLASPASSTGAPTFRQLVATDIPNLAQSQVTGLSSSLGALAPLAGATFTGAVVLPSGTPSGQQATSFAFTSSTYLALAGGTMTGALNTLDLTVNSANAASWSGTPTAGAHLTNKTYADTKAALAGATFTGNVGFSGTGIAGLVLNGITDTQRAALTPSNGMLIYNTTLSCLEYFNGAWLQVGTGQAASIYNGTGAPASTLGNNGDYYLSTTNGNIYQKSSGSWAVVFSAGGGITAAGGTFTGPVFITANISVNNNSAIGLGGLTAGILQFNNFATIQVTQAGCQIAGTVALNGTTAVVVNTTAVTASSFFLFGRNSLVGTAGECYVSAVVPGTSFSLKSTSASDTSNVSWLFIN